MRAKRACTLFVLLAACAPVAARADTTPWKKGEALLKQVAETYAAATSLSADVTESRLINGKIVIRRGTIRLRKPNLARLEWTDPPELTVWDGARRWTLTRSDNRYVKYNADAHGKDIEINVNPIVLFLDPRPLTFKPVAEYAGTEIVNGVEYRVVEATLFDGRQRHYIGPDNVIHRSVGRSGEDVLSNIVLNGAEEAKEFVFVPPPTATSCIKPTARNLIPAGHRVPDVAGITPAGERVTLYGLLKGKKAAIIHFWEYP